ncbi:phytanoyl-CoA dioxygenase family protein [Roseiterribacter gracilis]
MADLPGVSVEPTQPGLSGNLADTGFWRRLAPTLHVADAAYMQTLQGMQAPEAAMVQLEQLLIDEGYFQLPPQQWDVPIADLAACIKTLVAAEIPAPFCFVYDEFWMLYYRLHLMLQRLLGPDYRFLPDFWAWHVDPRKGERGWAPHRDKGYMALFPDRRPKSLTVWLPLTNATTLNGCMYMLPAHRDRVYATDKDTTWKENIDYAGIRALPADAGSILCWNQAVLHWGSSTSVRGAEPRISLAFEFQRGDVPPFNQPLMEPLQIWPLDARLRLIGKQILQYKHMYPLSPAMERIAEQLLAG